MKNTYEIDGIIFFVEPQKFKYIDWLNEHLDCDSIVTLETTACDPVGIICYAKSEEYNRNLAKLRDERFPNHAILVGYSSKEVNCID